MHTQFRTVLIALSAVSLLAACKPKEKTTPADGPGKNPEPPTRVTPAVPEGPFIAPLIDQARSVDVDVLWVQRKYNKKTRETESRGGTTRVTLTVLPNKAKVNRIGYTEQFPGGTGGMWRASLWIAAKSAAQAVGREMIDFGFLGGSRGFVDGPSAGALFTAGFMAAIMGVPVKADATMTGTVNPDGTVGLVGGLEHKFLAAIKRGKKILGYPVGNKIQKGKGGRLVNLESLAEEHGAKAYPVKDIYEAYKLLTGQDFPGRKRVTEKEMSFAATLVAKLKALALEWVKKHEQYVREGSRHKFNWQVRSWYSRRLHPGLLYKKLYDKQLKDGQFGAAYYSAVRSATWAYTAEKFTDVAWLWRQWNELAMKNQAKSHKLFMDILRKRREVQQMLAEKKECEKSKFKSPRCKALKKRLDKERAEMKKQLAAEKKKREALKKAKKARKGAIGAARGPGKKPVARKPVAKKPETKTERKEIIPPQPPKDFQKLLGDLAREMNGKTRTLEAVKKQLDTLKPTTIDEALSLVAANEEILQGTAFAMLSSHRLSRLNNYQRFQKYMQRRNERMKRTSSYNWYKGFQERRRISTTAQYVDETVKYAGIAFGKANLAKELAGLYMSGSKPIHVSRKRMKSVANQLFASAKANLDLISSVFKRQRFGSYYLNRLGDRNPEYVIARLGTIQAGRIVLKFQEDEEIAKNFDLDKGYTALGGAVASYMASMKLISKWFNNQVVHYTGSAVTRVGRPQALTNSLHRARIFALEAAHRAKMATGTIPTFSRILFQAASAYRQESLSGQVKALELYWRSALYSKLAEMLVRNVPGQEPVKASEPAKAPAPATRACVNPFDTILSSTLDKSVL